MFTANDEILLIKKALLIRYEKVGRSSIKFYFSRCETFTVKDIAVFILISQKCSFCTDRPKWETDFGICDSLKIFLIVCFTIR
jgi:hypothetical protein